MKIFIGLTEVSGYYSNLTKGFSELGFQAVHVPLQAHRFKYDEAAPSDMFVRWVRYCVRKRVSLSESSRFRAFFWLFLVAVTRLLLFTWAVIKFDVFILGGGSSFFSFRELPLLRLLGKKIVYTFYGTDARPPYIDGFFTPDQIGMKWPPSGAMEDPSRWDEESRQRIMAEALRLETIRRKAAVSAAERYAHAVICGPSYAQFLTRDFVNFFVIGFPQDIEVEAQATTRPTGQAVRILHAPSQSEGKGTAGIRRAVENLKQKGLDLDYVEVSGRPNKEVIDEIARCDFVIDQLYSDTPMAGFASEAAFISKPAVIGSYYSDLVKNQMREEFIPPSLFCHPDAIEQSIHKLASDTGFRVALGARAAEFVKSRWRAKKVAERYLHLIAGDIPEEWKFSPRQVTYVHGVGISEDRIKSNVKLLISRYGVRSLQLGDNPRLERLLVTLAYPVQA